ncbi:MAG: hypothetical protein SGJ20_21485 [Planctomycetota bacterium]|nr:hypothetical protein [Planctomycetota bacterium]
MNDNTDFNSPIDIPEPLSALRPAKTIESLRSRVLNAVDAELQQKPNSPAKTAKPRTARNWERIAQWSVAVGLLLGIGLHVQAWQANESRSAMHGLGPTYAVNGTALAVKPASQRRDSLERYLLALATASRDLERADFRFHTSNRRN